MYNNTYLGDGVYASFDGYQIWLAVDNIGKVLALDPDVFDALVQYAQSLKFAPGGTND